MGSPLLFIVLSFLYPASYLLQINSHIYTTGQIITTIIFVLLISVITALAAGGFVGFGLKITLPVARKFMSKTDFSPDIKKLYRALLSGVGTLILLILLHSATRGLLPMFRNAFWILPYLIISLGSSIFTYHFQLKFFNIILSGLILINGVLGIFHIFKKETLTLDIVKPRNVIFKQKPNVYLVILESYTSLEIRDRVYGIDNKPLIQELIENKFDIRSIYSNYGDTLSAITSTFVMDHHYYKLSEGIADGGGYRKIIGGVYNNHVLNIFLNNGYRIDYNKFPSGLYHPSPLINSQESQPLLQPIEVFSGLFAIYYKIYKDFFWNSEIVQSFLWLPEKIIGKLSTHSGNGDKAYADMPTFYLIYAGAGHANRSFLQYPSEIKSMPNARQMPFWKLNRVNNYWVSKYKDMIAKSDKELIQFVCEITEKDPEAIIILLGDHGTSYNKNRWMGSKKDLNENMLDNGIRPAEVTRDIFEVLMAIKWPDNKKESFAYFSNVNLFRHIFSILSEDPSILKMQAANDSFILTSKNDSFLRKTSIYRTVKDGKPLERWEPFATPLMK